ncbi:ATP-dependent DNA helicase UvrD2 [Arcanobacterium haemolyticum]|nr:ATP-dependent DNA helicase UvrD2 [Arcanobacterium haemolyticum]
MENDLLAHLDPDQRRVAETLVGPLCVRAGAGTGKTRAITYRIAHGVRTGAYAPGNVLAVTFTSRAAGEMRSRLRDLGVGGVSAQTFHAAALRQLSYFWPTAVGGKIPPIVEHKLALVSQAAATIGLSTDKVAVRDLAAEVEWSKVSLVAHEKYADTAIQAGRTEVAGHSPAEITQLLRAYEEIKTERGVIDFEDVLLILVGILLDRPDITRAIRQQYRYFVVDEYQDVSPLQHRLLQLWLGDRKDLCVVGDVSQTIYSFTGASSHYLAEFTREFPQANVVELVRDYRSSPQIVTVANEVIAPDQSEGAVHLVSQLPSSVPVQWHEYGDDTGEADGIAAQILELSKQGVPLREMAILYRTNAQSVQFEEALSRAGIGYQVRGSERFFSRREVREVMVALRAAARAGVEGSLSENVRTVLRQSGWRDGAPEQAGAVRDRWEALNALLNLAKEMENARGASMLEFVHELEERAQLQNAPEVEGVTLSSLHAAKGLEWECVFLAGASEGLIPISLAKGDSGIAEERRLLYVGITRAKQHLHISYASSNGNRATRKVSRFLRNVWPQPEKPVSRTTSYRKRREEEKEKFAREHPDDLELLEALIQWRARVAAEIDRPAYTVLHDTSLRAIAVAKPATLAQLGRIKGIGATKLAAWGNVILAVVAGERGFM